MTNTKFNITISADATLANLRDLYNALPTTTKPIKKFSSKAQAITRTTEALTQAFETHDPTDLAKTLTDDLTEHVTVTPTKTTKSNKSSGRNNAMHNAPIKVLTTTFIARPNTMRQRMLQYIVDHDTKTVKDIMDSWYTTESNNGKIAKQDTALIDANMFLVAVEKGIIAPFTTRQTDAVAPAPATA